MTELTFADFFAGIGLARLGLEQAGWQVRFANDIDPKKFQMYCDNFGDADSYVVEDVHKLTVSQIPDVTLWWASFPCTDVSLAGYRKGLAGQQSGSLLPLLRLLDRKDGQRPAMVVLENVTGFATSRGGKDFTDTVRELNRLGYSCDAFVLNAIHFVPQSRPRLFIVGIYDCPVTSDVAAALAQRDDRLRWHRLSDLMTESAGLRWVILDMPPPPRRPSSLASVVEELPESSPRWWLQERVEYLLNQMSSRHRRIIEALLNGRERRYATVYRRMRFGKSMAELRADNIAGCLRTPRGGSSRQILIEVGSGNLRARFMTPTEYARLMGAPGYNIDVADNQAYFGFGDAVCVPAVRWIGENVLNPVVKRASPVAMDHVGAQVS